MHPLNNGSQAITKPTPKARVGNQGYFTESGENNAPSYPGADWYNAVIDEFLAMLTEMSIAFDPDKFDHWQKAMAALKNDASTKASAAQTAAASDATTKANQALSDAKTYSDHQNSTALQSAIQHADAGANWALDNAKSFVADSYMLNEHLSQNVNDIAAYNYVVQLEDSSPSGGSFIQLLISGTGNFGGLERSSYLVTFACRGVSNKLRVLRLNTASESNSPIFYTYYDAQTKKHQLFCSTGPYWYNTNVAVLANMTSTLKNKKVYSIPSGATQQQYDHIITNDSLDTIFEQRFPSSEKYFKSNGKIIQFGNGVGAGNVTLPIAFPNSFDVVLVTNTTQQGDRVDNAFGYIVDNATFFAGSKSSTANSVTGAPYSWMAIGD